MMVLVEDAFNQMARRMRRRFPTWQKEIRRSTMPLDQWSRDLFTGACRSVHTQGGNL